MILLSSSFSNPRLPNVHNLAYLVQFFPYSLPFPCLLTALLLALPCACSTMMSGSGFDFREPPASPSRTPLVDITPPRSKCSSCFSHGGHGGQCSCSTYSQSHRRSPLSTFCLAHDHPLTTITDDDQDSDFEAHIDSDSENQPPLHIKQPFVSAPSTTTPESIFPWCTILEGEYHGVWSSQ